MKKKTVKGWALINNSAEPGKLADWWLTLPGGKYDFGAPAPRIYLMKLDAEKDAEQQNYRVKGLLTVVPVTITYTPPTNTKSKV